MVMIERGDNLVNGMVLEHVLGNPQGWRGRTLLDLKAIDARPALLLQLRFRRFECFIHPRSNAVERLLRHRHCSLFTAANGLQPPHGCCWPPISLKRLGNVVTLPDVSPCVRPKAPPRTPSARHCASICARGICRPAYRPALGFHHVGCANERRKWLRRHAVRLGSHSCGAPDLRSGGGETPAPVRILLRAPRTSAAARDRAVIVEAFPVGGGPHG